MLKPAPAVLSTVLSLTLVTGMCPAVAFAEAAYEPQEIALEEVTETDEAADAPEEPAAGVAEEQPAENEGQPEEPSDDATTEPDGGTDAGEAEPGGDATETPTETVDGTEAATPAEGSATETTSTEGKTADQATDEAAAQAATYTHTATAEQNGVTFAVGWDDAPAGSATTFHVTQTGGSRAAKARMDVPTYWDTDGSQESVCDPTRSQWGGYCELGADGCDFSFELTASGAYRINFYFMDAESNIWYLRATAVAEVDDGARPSVTQIVNGAVAQCYAETSGSEYDVALWLHDWTLDQLDYDHSLNWCSAESGLTRGQGTCESYQRIYAKLLNAAGIANGRVEGNGHTWNAVRIDGRWCQMDLTWDDTSDSWYGDLDQRHLYFGLTDELMAMAHSDHAGTYQADGYAYRSTDLSNDCFVRNGRADEWASAYAERIQQHLDAKEMSFSIDADNGSFPPSISGIQNAIVAYAMNQKEWSTGGETVTLTATSNVTTTSSYEWSAGFDFTAEYPGVSATPGTPPIPDPVVADGTYLVTAAVAPKMGVAAAESGCSLSASAGALAFERDAATGLYRISSGGRLLTESGSAAVLADPDGSAAQLWRLDECEWGYTVTASSGLMLDDRYCETSEGNPVWLYERNGSAAQAWKIAHQAQPRVIADGTYLVAAAVAPKMGVAAAESGCSLSASAGALAFERDAATGLYRISSGGRLLTESGSAAVLADPDGSAAQLWRLDECEWGYTVTASSGLMLDDRYCETSEGNPVWLYERNGSAAQAWRLN